MALLTIAVPSYNSEDHLAQCLDSLLPGGETLEVIIVNDGSTDDTAAIAERYVAQYPQIFRLISQENAGHGAGINVALEHATSPWFKVLDSDDRFDREALEKVLAKLTEWHTANIRPDLIITNYVYERHSWKDGVHKVTNKRIRYKNIFEEEAPQSWASMGTMKLDQLMMMHAMIYRTELIRDEVKLKLPHHTSYEDNLYVCVPLPHVKEIRYLDENLYIYFIGRPEQSVNLNSLIKKADNQLLVTRELLYSFDDWSKLQPNRLRRYLVRHFIRLVAMSILALTIRGREEDKQKLRALWQDIKDHDPNLYRKARSHPMPVGQALLLVLKPDMRERVYRWIGKTWRFN